MVRKLLLVCGILSSLLYATLTVFVAMQWADYSSAAQTVSELSAIGAPTRSLWVLPAALYTVLVTAFGWGVWKSAGRTHALRIVGGLILIYGSLGLFWPFAPMHLRETLAAGGGTLSDTAHIVLASVTVVLMLLAIGVGAAAFGKRFRVYSIASLLILGVFGALTFRDAPRLSANLPTPWLGIWERINIGVFLLWVVVLATALWTGHGDDRAASRPRSAFKTPEGEAAYLATYDAAMKLWPVAYEPIDVPGRFGTTHLVVTGPQEAPPLVLLHGYMATSTMWSANIADLSKDHRVYAIDVMGQPGKSIPGEPIRNEADYAAWLTGVLDGLRLDRIFLAGMSYGGWLALNYAIATPERVQKLVLLSPGGGFVPMTRQFSLRGLAMMWCPTRVTVNAFMRWLGLTDRRGDTETTLVVDLMYLGLKHFRVPPETLRVMPVLFPEAQLRAMRVPTLLLVGEHEVICDPAAALERARRFFPDVRAELVPLSSHDMTFSQHRIVDARVLDFLKETRTGDRGRMTERSVA
jgi:pimeloyl-ACP methyl ester carboxylesterase